VPIINADIEVGVGPVLNAYFIVSAPRRAALLAAGQAVPPPVSVRLLVDTGASMTSVDGALIGSLSLPIVGMVPMLTPSTNGKPVSCLQLDAGLIVPGATPSDMLIVGALPIIVTSFQGQSINGLLGRDVLDRCMLVYHGTAAHISLAH
jgi:hypothetical protein